MQYPLFITGDAPVLQDSMTVTAVTNVNGSNANQTIITATGSGSITTGQLNGMILRLTSGATSGYEAMIADHQASGTTHTIRIGMYAGGTNQALTIGVGTTFGVYAHDAIFNISAGSSPQWLLNSMKAGIRRIRFNLNGSAANTRVSIFSDNSIHLQAVSLVTATGSSNSTNFNVTTANFSSGLNGGIMAEGVYSPAGAGEVTGIAAIGLNGTAKMTVTMSSPFQRFYATASRYATWNFSALSCTRLFGGHFYNSSIQVSADIETFSTGIEIDASDAPIVATANTSTYLGAFLQTSGTATLASWSSIVTGGLCPASWYGVVSYGNMTLMTACRITGFTAGGLLVAAGGSVRLQGNSGNLFIGNNTGSGVTVQHNGTLAVYGRTSNGLTGTSNTQYGVSVSAGGRLVVLLPGTSTTITGTLGDVQFGSQVLAWASVPASSAIEALGQIDVSGQVNTTADYRINASRVLTANSTQLLVGRSIASAPSGTLLTVVGNGAGAALTTGTGHTAVGANALALMTSGNSCVGIGDNCLAKATGQFNTGVGSSAGFNVTTGGSNVLIGDQAGTAITTGSHTTAVGSNAGSAISTNSNSVYVGWNAGNTATGGDNVLIGAAAGSGLTSGTNNTLLGVTAGVSSGTLSDCIVIGANAQAQNSGELALGSLGNPLTTALTVGAAGAASGLPASPDAYLQVRINGTLYKVPLFAV